ncbi:MAG: site-specific DNA-methyltransferase [Myxococcota bacterium]
MSDGIELRWPGKYDDDGQRVPVPRPGAMLHRRMVYGPCGADDAEPPPEPTGWHNRLVEGDNLWALDALVREHAGTVDLVYIDPPFATGGRFDVVSPVGPRPARGEGKGIELRRPAYTDTWPGGMAGLLGMLDPRLRLVHQLLAPHGSLYVHVDPTMGHAIKLMLDEIFGPGCFQREIVWRIGWVSGFKSAARNWIRNHDLLFFYVKDPRRFTFNKRYLPHPPGYRRRDGALPRGKGVPLDDVWNAGDAELALRGSESLDSIQIKSFSTEKTGYATQKNESILRRIVEVSSDPGDLVADVFCGSGTTLRVAEQLGRRWIGCDLGCSAIHISTARLLQGARSRPFALELAQVPVAPVPAAEIDARAQQAWVALAGDDASSLQVVAVHDEPVRARRSAPTAIAAEHWSLPVPWEIHDGSVWVGEAWPPQGRGRAAALRAPAQLVIQRELLEPELGPRPELGLAERGRVIVALHGLHEGVAEVELGGLGYPHTAWLPSVLREATLGPLELVEWWTVTWDARDDVPVDAVMGRFARDRVLPTVSPAHSLAGQEAQLVVRVFDVLHREHHLTCRLVRAEQGWQVVHARARAFGRSTTPPDAVGSAESIADASDQLALALEPRGPAEPPR